MRRKIQNSMILMISLSVMASFVVMTLALCRQTLTIVENEIIQEADYMCAAIEISGGSYL